jgi:uncharacterized membrane protein YphA (DoxX/SURF4 family)
MPANKLLYPLLTAFIALVWIVNGLLFKVLNLVPRHHLIVAEILGSSHSSLLTTAIGIGEILVGVWILVGFTRRLCALVQMCLVAVMNIIELVLVPDLLLFGAWNVLLAGFFVLLVYLHAYVLKNPNPTSSSA